MEYTEYISNKSILGIIRRVCNYVDSRLMDHGMRVSYLVWKMLYPLGDYSREELRDICFLSILHDIGAYKTEEINRMINFETDNIWEHSIYGYLFMRCFSPLENKAGIILLHHITWDVLKQQEEIDDDIKEIAQVLFLADRIDVSMDVEHNSWEKTLEIVRAGKGTRFSPAAVALAETLTFPLPLEEAAVADTQYYHTLSDYLLTHSQITDYLKMIIFSIDFRSRHTVTHTVTTTSISAEIARYMGLDEHVRNQIVCGALLHDVGKIGVPVEILEYPGRLSPQAMAVMRTHVDICEKIFGGEIEESIKRIALRHHEKMNGSGYPKGLCAADLTIPERIVAIADIISALAGTRSYKDAYGKDRIISILTDMIQNDLIDPDITETAISHFDEIMELTGVRCSPLISIYQEIQDEYQTLMHASSPGQMIRMAWKRYQLFSKSPVTEGS